MARTAATTLREYMAALLSYLLSLPSALARCRRLLREPLELPRNEAPVPLALVGSPSRIQGAAGHSVRRGWALHRGTGKV